MQPRPADVVATSPVFSWRVRPGGGDDRLELRPEQVDVRADDGEERLVDRGGDQVVRIGSHGHGVTARLRR
jgi:hypothetical protein